METEHPSLPIYKRLNADSKEIRLICLKSVNATNGILQCRTGLTSLDDRCHLPYCALSYEWNPPSLRNQDESVLAEVSMNYVELDGQRLPTTLNLNSVLWTLYQGVDGESSNDNIQDRWLWIDAICINQKDLDERAQQVEMMGQIYSSADQVWSWTGRLMKMAHLKAFEDIIAAANPANEESSNRSIADTLERQLTEGQHPFDPLTIISSSSYWARTWIIQEVALAKQRRLICCFFDNEAITLRFADIDAFFDVLRVLRYAYNTREARKHPNNLTDANWRLLSVNKVCSDVATPRTLLEALAAFPGQESTDPRDRIYGLLSIVRPYEGRKVAVDYRSSVAEVFTQSAVAIIQGEGNLELLAFSGCHREGLPTWAPDWTMSYPFSQTPWDQTSPKAISSILQSHIQKGILEVSSVTLEISTLPVVEQVENVEPSRTNKSDDLPCIINLVQQLLRSLFSMNAPSMAMEEEETVELVGLCWELSRLLLVELYEASQLASFDHNSLRGRLRRETNEAFANICTKFLESSASIPQFSPIEEKFLLSTFSKPMQAFLVRLPKDSVLASTFFSEFRRPDGTQWAIESHGNYVFLPGFMYQANKILITAYDRFSLVTGCSQTLVLEPSSQAEKVYKVKGPAWVAGINMRRGYDGLTYSQIHLI